MEKPTKTSSGKWRIRVLLGCDPDGRRAYKSIQADTRAECLEKARAYSYAVEHGLIEPPTRPKIADLTRVCDAVDKYIDLCATLSPTTVSGYDKIRRTAFPHLMQTPIADLNDEIIQEAINTEARRVGRRGQISPKTLSNEWALISSALWHVSRVKFDVRLPKRQRTPKDYPEPSDVLAAIHGTPVELPCLLAMWCGLRMSEIRGLMWQDIRGDFLTIRRVLVDVGTVPTLKDTAKTSASKRRVPLPEHIRELLAATPQESEFIIPLNHDQIYDQYRRIMDRAGLDITFHDLRHYFASIGMLLHIPDAYIQQDGGWATDHIMKSVYFDTYSSERRRAFEVRNNYMQTLLREVRQTTSCIPLCDKKCDKIPKTIEKRAFRRGSIPLGSTKDDDFSEDDKP